MEAAELFYAFYLFRQCGNNSESAVARSWMPSQILFRRSQSLLRASTSFCSATRSGRPQADQTKGQSLLRLNGHLNTRLASTTFPSTDAEAGPSSAEAPPEGEKPKRSRKSASKDFDPPQLPASLDILWTPDFDCSYTGTPRHALPPSDIFEEALANLHITLLPRTQHRATYKSPDGPPVEPTFALYCPIEGGEYIIDETVRELARRTNADVVVLDSVQLAAGEWGHFGKGEPHICLLAAHLYTTR
jgi:hypothetical protein